MSECMVRLILAFITIVGGTFSLVSIFGPPGHLSSLIRLVVTGVFAVIGITAVAVFILEPRF